uniref:Brevican n=1 Tax=Latimeria chalumnae TaxID=7897 RepID=H3A9N1_LATCH
MSLRLRLLLGILVSTGCPLQEQLVCVLFYLKYFLLSVDDASALKVTIPALWPLSGVLSNSLTIPCYVSQSSSTFHAGRRAVLGMPRVKWSYISNGRESEILVARGQKVKVSEAYKLRVSLPHYPESPTDFSLTLKELRSNDSGIYRCEVQRGLEDSQDLVEVKVKGVVFLYRDALTRYAFTFEKAQWACAGIGASIATPEQLLAAYHSGYEQCDAGWIADQTVRYPIQAPRAACYGDMDGYPGVRNYGVVDPEDMYDVYCYVEDLKGEVFSNSTPEKFTLEEAKRFCEEQGAEIATTGQLYAAWNEGLDQCDPGWLADGSVRYPIVTPRERCGGSLPGVKTIYLFKNQTGFPDPSSRYNVFCLRGREKPFTDSPLGYQSTEPEDVTGVTEMVEETSLPMAVGGNEARGIHDNIMLSENNASLNYENPSTKNPPKQNILTISQYELTITSSRELTTFAIAEPMRDLESVTEVTSFLTETSPDVSGSGAQVVEMEHSRFHDASGVPTTPSYSQEQAGQGVEEITLKGHGKLAPEIIDTVGQINSKLGGTVPDQHMEGSTESSGVHEPVGVSTTVMSTLQVGTEHSGVSGETSGSHLFESKEPEASGELYSGTVPITTIKEATDLGTEGTPASELTTTPAAYEDMTTLESKGITGFELSTPPVDLFKEATEERLEGILKSGPHFDLFTEQEMEIPSTTFPLTTSPPQPIKPTERASLGEGMSLSVSSRSLNYLNFYDSNTDHSHCPGACRSPSRVPHGSIQGKGISTTIGTIIPPHMFLHLTHEPPDGKNGPAMYMSQRQVDPCSECDTGGWLITKKTTVSLKLTTITLLITSVSSQTSHQACWEQISRTNSQAYQNFCQGSPRRKFLASGFILTSSTLARVSAILVQNSTVSKIIFLPYNTTTTITRKVNTLDCSVHSLSNTPGESPLCCLKLQNAHEEKKSPSSFQSHETMSPSARTKPHAHPQSWIKNATALVLSAILGARSPENQEPWINMGFISDVFPNRVRTNFISDGCFPNPCENGGTCIEERDGVKCMCLPSYGGELCETSLDDCNPGWEKFQGFCYRHFTYRHSWEDAEQHCRMWGGYLASVMSPEEQNFINNRFKEYQWIGLNDRTIEGDFRWSDGNPLLYENWYHGQPDSYFLSGEDCVVMVWHDGGRWSDVPCNYHLSYTCKMGISTCGAPPAVENAKTSGKPKPRYETHAIVRYQCNEGFTQQHSPVISCQADGKWERPQIACLP